MSLVQLVTSHMHDTKCRMLSFFPSHVFPTVYKRRLLAEKSLEDMSVQEFGKTLSIAIIIKILFVLMCH